MQRNKQFVQCEVVQTQLGLICLGWLVEDCLIADIRDGISLTPEALPNLLRLVLCQQR